MKKKGNKKMPTPDTKPHPYIFVSFIYYVAFGYHCVFLDYVFLCILNKQSNIIEQNKDVGMGKYERVSAGMGGSKTKM